MKRILITGASGQDGIILSDILIKKKYKVFGIIRKNKSNNLNKNIKYLNINLNNYKELKKKFNKINPDYVIHLASKNPSYKELQRKKNFFEENFKILKNLINYITQNNNKIKLIFPGSSQMYGNINTRVNENNKFKPQNTYSLYRVKSHNLLIKNKRNNKLKFTTVILFNHDSVFRHKKFLLPRVVKALKKKDKSFLNNIIKENIHADFSHAYDICYGIYLLIKSNKDFDKIIFSSNKLTSLNNIIRYLIKKMSIKIDLDFSKNLGNKKNIIGNNTKAKNILKWKPKKNILLAANELFNNID